MRLASPPLPTPAERLVRQRISADGPLTFAQFMELALYDPEVGYYSRPASPFGERGDFYTSSQLHPAFAALLARQVVQLWEWLARPTPFVLHEAGPGSGLFARDLLDWTRATWPELYAALDYRLDERSSARRLQQQRLLAHQGHLEHVQWVEGFDHDRPVNLLLANELLDALPVHLVEQQSDSLVELFVGLDSDRLTFLRGQPSTPDLAAYFEKLALWLGEGNRAEVNLAALNWLAAAADTVGPGLVMLLDYGYPAEQLFAASRHRGTLLCYRQHTLNSDPLVHVGQQDLTSHVDFTSLRWAGERAGLETLGLVSQRRLLNNLGLTGLVAALDRQGLPQAERDANLRALEALRDPTGLGRMLALFQSRDLPDFEPIGLLGGPQPDWSRLPLRGSHHTHLPGAAEAEGLLDFESQWAEFWSGDETSD